MYLRTHSLSTMYRSNLVMNDLNIVVDRKRTRDQYESTENIPNCLRGEAPEVVVKRSAGDLKMMKFKFVSCI